MKKAYRASLLRFDGDGRALYDTDGLLVVAPDAQGRPVPVDAFAPATPGEMALAQRARAYLEAGRGTAGGAAGAVPRGMAGTVASP